MKIDPKLILNTNLNSPKASQAPGKIAAKKIFSSEYNVTRGFLILSSEQKDACDSKKTYYINRDGSGRTVTPWGSEEFPPDTFSEVLTGAKAISEKKNSVIFSPDEIEVLIASAEAKILEAKDDKN